VRPTRTVTSSSHKALFERWCGRPSGSFRDIFRALWRRGREICSPASWRGVPRRASAWARGAGARGKVLFGASRPGRGFEAPRGLQPGDVRAFLWCALAGEGVEAHDFHPGEVFGACRRGKRLWGARSSVRCRGDVFLGAWFLEWLLPLLVQVLVAGPLHHPPLLTSHFTEHGTYDQEPPDVTPPPFLWTFLPLGLMGS